MQNKGSLACHCDLQFITFTKLTTLCSLFQLTSEWVQVEVIDLLNDGTGLGFGIIGGKSTGVVVKTILPGGVADKVGTMNLVHEMYFLWILYLSTRFHVNHRPILVLGLWCRLRLKTGIRLLQRCDD